jgi:hypothetical protein
MFTRLFTRFIVIDATVIVVMTVVAFPVAISAQGMSGSRGIQRSFWAGRRGSSRHGRQRVHIELCSLYSGGSAGDRQ